MRATTYRGPYKVRVENKPIPAIEHPNDAIIKVSLAAIRGSDLHLYHGMMPDTASVTPSVTSSWARFTRSVRPYRTSGPGTA